MINDIELQAECRGRVSDLVDAQIQYQVINQISERLCGQVNRPIRVQVMKQMWDRVAAQVRCIVWSQLY